MTISAENIELVTVIATLAIVIWNSISMRDIRNSIENLKETFGKLIAYNREDIKEMRNKVDHYLFMEKFSSSTVRTNGPINPTEGNYSPTSTNYPEKD